jgi:small GTP-binding protein
MNRESWEYDVFCKVILTGDSSVGKSCLMQRYTDDQFDETQQSTIGVGLRVITQEIERKDSYGRTQQLRAKLTLWDTAGQERFKSITVGYYRGAHAILVVFDKTNEESFLNVKDWLKEIDMYASEHVQIILVGNKCDKICECVVDRERAELFAQEYGITYIETSARTGHNVDVAFTSLITTVVESSAFLNHESENGSTVIPSPTTPTTAKASCCRLA